MSRKVRKYDPICLGQKFTRWTVVEDLVITNRRHYYKCQCLCGKIRSVLKQALHAGTSKSCGCITIGRPNTKRVLPNALSAKRTLFAAYKKGAETRDLKWEVGFDLFVDITSKHCTYCGAKPAQVRKANSSAENYTYNGIDRIDNSKGYTPQNITACCKLCNKLKAGLDPDFFKNHISKIARHLTVGSNLSLVENRPELARQIYLDIQDNSW